MSTIHKYSKLMNTISRRSPQQNLSSGSSTRYHNR